MQVGIQDYLHQLGGISVTVSLFGQQRWACDHDFECHGQWFL